MHVTGSRAYARPPPVPKMPSGLEQLMEGLTKEVLKNNPSDIYKFCANHMLNLLEIRDGHVLKRTLTLEEKILKAQERVRQREKERCERYDQSLQPIESKGATTSNAEDCKGLEIKEVLQLESSLLSQHNLVDATVLVVTESKLINKEKNFNPKTLEILPIGLEENASNIVTINDQQFNEDNNYYNKDLTKEIKEIPKNLGEDVTELTEEISLLVEKKHDIDNAELVLEDVNSSDQKPLIEVRTENIQDEENQTKHNIKSATENPQKYESSDIILKTEFIDTLNSKLPVQLIDNDYSEIKKNYKLKDEYQICDLTVENSSVIGDNNSDLKEDHALSNTTNILLYITKLSNTPKQDIEGNSKLYNNKEIVENADLEIGNPLNTLTTLEHNIEMFDDNLSGSKGLIEKQCNEANVAVLLVEENPITLQENLNSLENEKFKNINNEETIGIGKNIDDENLSKNHVSNNMNLETAAITIQKVFRNFLFKSRASTFEDETNDETNTLEEISDPKEDSEYSLIRANLGNERRPLENMRMDTVLQTVNEEKSLSLSTDDSSTLSSAATIIQAHVRGFLVRNKLDSLKTSTNSLAKSNGPPSPPSENDVDMQKGKTPLNIHIVPETNHFLSRDESVIVSMDLSLDSSPPTSVNLHPLGYDKSERRKLKREDAVQSFSPPSINSGKLSEDIDPMNENTMKYDDNNSKAKDLGLECVESEVSGIVLGENTLHDVYTESSNDIESNSSQHDTVIDNEHRKDSLTISSDETDVVTPFSITPASTPTLSHTGEFHDVVLPTKVSRGDTSVVRGE